MLTRSFYRSTVCNRIDRRKRGNFSLIQRNLQTICSCRFHTDHFDVRVQQFCQCGNTGSQSATADGNQNIINQRKLFDDLHSDGSLSGCYCRIIEGMDKCISMFFCQLISMCACIIVDISIQDNFRTVAFCSLDFDQWCCGRHNDDSLCTVCFCRISHTLRMITCGSGDQTFCSLFFCQCTDLIVRTS